MSQFRPVVAAAAAIVVLVAGCGDSDATSGSEEPVRSGAEDASAFPVSVTADNGPMTLDEAPEAIVVLSPSITEMLYAVGAGDQIVAVDSSSNHPEGTPMTDISGFRPNVEAIGALEPDLVVLARDSDGIVATLADVGIPVLLLEAAADLDEVYGQITTLGTATGHRTEAEDLVEVMRSEISGLIDTVTVPEPPLGYFYELSGDYHTITSQSFVGSVLDELGLENIADGVDEAAGPFPQLTAEYVLDSDPDLVFFAHGDGSVPAAEEVAARPGWDELTAVTDGGLVFLDIDVASRWGPRLVDLVAAVAAAVEDHATR